MTALLVGDRLRRAILRSGKSQKEIATKAGIGPDALSNILHGRTRDPKFSTVERIIRAIGTTFGAVFGEVEMLLLPRDVRVMRAGAETTLRVTSNAAAQAEGREERERTAPRRRSEIRDAPPDSYSDVVQLHDVAVPPAAQLGGASRVFRVETDAMIEAGILVDSLIFVRLTTHLDAADGRIVLYQVKNARLLRQLELHGGEIVLASRSPKYDPITVEPKDGQLIGVVVDER